jgi:hypothetical protein
MGTFSGYVLWIFLANGNVTAQASYPTWCDCLRTQEALTILQEVHEQPDKQPIKYMQCFPDGSPEPPITTCQKITPAPQQAEPTTAPRS